MKRSMAILITMVVFATLLGSLAIVQNTSAEDMDVNPGYHLTPVRWQVTVASSGGGFHLQIPGSRSLSGSGCCCVNLPCILKK